ncbi:MAG: XRE family transcriptional regulator [Magnetospirillum sp.]|nr:MAG: XRE family transcriptional regulator [Magnetospirillum sp.]
MAPMLKERLKLAREARGWALTELGRWMMPPVTRSTISHWEAGRSRPKRDNLFQVVKLLGVTVEWLRGDSSDGGPDAGRSLFRRDLLRKVEIAFEAYLQANGLEMEPDGRWETLEAIYEWAEDTERGYGPDYPLKIDSVRAFLHRVRDRRSR